MRPLKHLTKIFILCSIILMVRAAQPILRTVQATIDPYPLQLYPGGSNAVITIYKSTSLGTVWTPFKPTTIFPATRTSQLFQVIVPNSFRFYATCTIQPYGESKPSNVVTNSFTTSSTNSVNLNINEN